MRLVKALAALVALITVLFGIPALLLAWGHPMALLDVEWSSALQRPDDGTIVFGVLSLAGWVAWAILALTLVTEVICQLSRQRLRIRLPGVTWLQPVAGALVAMALTPVLTVRADDATPPPTVHAPAVPEAPVSKSQHPTVRTSGRVYEVRPGDELWSVAEAQLGSGTAWRTILACNPGMTADTVLVPGTTILLPEATTMAVADDRNAPHHITVTRGDTLWDLAETHLGDARRWPQLYAANRDIIADPDEIDVGWTLELPPRLSPPETVEETPSVPAEPEPESPPSSPPSDEASADELPAVVAGRRDEGAPVPPGTPATTAAPTASAPPPAPHHQEPPPPPGPDTSATSAAADSETALDLLGPIGGVLAASLVAGVAAHRHAQLLQRGVGRRIPSLAPALQRFFSALVHRCEDEPETPMEVGPTAVIVGWDDDSDVRIDLEGERCTVIAGADEHTAAMAATVVTGLLCANWSRSVEVVVVEPHDDWEALDDPRLTRQSSVEEALTDLQRVCAGRRLQLGHSDLSTVRADDDRADAWAPVVFVFCQPIRPGHLDRIHDCLALGKVGVSVVAATRDIPERSPASVLQIVSETAARISNTHREFQPQLLTRPARRAVISLFAAALDERTEPAPWWGDGDPAEVIDLPNTAPEPIKDDAMPAWSPHPDHPTLLVLGPVELTGAAGAPPARAAGQCLEYCAWLLLHPGATPTAMVRDLLVAEGTRRSNMSRLRTWLGSDSSGNPYLPDAYTGHITLAPDVTSDWERFEFLLSQGVQRTSTALLRQALSLVRGQPLEGVAFQWPWASQWHTDMVSMITDVAAVLADRYVADDDLDGALWALTQGHKAVGDDETLAVRRIQVLARAGEHAEVDAAVMHLTRRARTENRDLTPESIHRIQHALHLTGSNTGTVKKDVELLDR